MPKYKLSPEERAVEKERKENLRNLMQGLDVKNFDDLKDVFKLMVGEMLENGLEGELDDELGYTKYDYRNKTGENSRNGYSRKTLKTSFGDTEIRVPRDRNGEFETQLIKKNQTTLTGDIEEKILSMYAKGMTTKDIESHIREIYGLECSDTVISRVADKILAAGKRVAVKTAGGDIRSGLYGRNSLSCVQRRADSEKIGIHSDRYTHGRTQRSRRLVGL